LRDRQAHCLPVIEIFSVGYVQVYFRTFFHLARREGPSGNQLLEINRFGPALCFERTEIEALLSYCGANQQYGRNNPNNFDHAARGKDVDENASIDYSWSVGDHSCLLLPAP
jgi:hypothetical protein